MLTRRAIDLEGGEVAFEGEEGGGLAHELSQIGGGAHRGLTAAQACSRSQGRSAIGHPLDLHRLALAAVGNRDQPEIVADRVNLAEEALRIRNHAARAIEAADAPMI